MSVEIRSFTSKALLMEALADRVGADLRTARAERTRATLAVPGGTTPEPFLTALGQRNLDWSGISVTLTDERWVPPSDARSNERLLRGSLLQGDAAGARFIPLHADTAEPEEGLAEVEAALAPALPLDVCVLGMGADGHTASLFPGADRLADALDPGCPALVLPMRAPGAPEPRITLTAPVLTAARRTYLLITGREKREVLDRALEDGPVEQAPVRAILRGPGPVIVYHAP